MISSGSFLQNLTTSSCVFFLLCVVVAVLGTVEITSHYALLVLGIWYSVVKVLVAFCRSFSARLTSRCIIGLSLALLAHSAPQQRNDSRKEKLFARKPIREMLKNILFPAKLFRDEEKHLGLFDRNWIFLTLKGSKLSSIAPHNLRLLAMLQKWFFSLSRTLQESLAIIS